MKIKIEIDDNLTEEEVIIRCRELTPEIQGLHENVKHGMAAFRQFVFYKDDVEYYLDLKDILFFETADQDVYAHTKAEMYQVKHRLYELEDLLPGFFTRVSKSTILNTNHIYSIERNLTASSVVAFQGTHKQVYVSRHYYKPLRLLLEEKRIMR